MNFETVFIYLCVFGISVFFIKLAEVQFNRLDCCNDENALLKGRNKSIVKTCAVIFFTVAVLPPCLLAAFRGMDVGIDISVYILPNWSVALFDDSSFSVFYSNMSVETEVLFAFLIYISAKYFNIQFLFFIIQLLIVLPTYLALFYCRKHISMSFGAVVFFLLFYNFTLSGMRQGIAMAFLLLAVSLFANKKIKQSVFLVAAAALFHISVIIIVFAVLLILLIEKSKNRSILNICLAAGLMIVFVFYRSIALVICSIVSLFNQRYSYYIMKYLYDGFRWSDVPGADLLSKSLLVLFVICSLHIFYKRKKFPAPVMFLTVLCVLGRYFTLFNANFYESMRIAYYFDYFLIILIPLIKKRCYRNDFSNQIVVDGIVAVPLILFWGYFIMYIGAYQTNNFVFNF